MFNRSTPALIHRKVLVNLLSGNALAGVVTFEGRHALVLRGATVHTTDSDPAPADGEVLIDRASIDFIQML